MVPPGLPSDTKDHVESPVSLSSTAPAAASAAGLA